MTAHEQSCSPIQERTQNEQHEGAGAQACSTLHQRRAGAVRDCWSLAPPVGAHLPRHGPG